MFIKKDRAPKIKRAAQKVETRARVLEVARTELERVGFEATNIREVARVAGVAPGTVLLHFKDKADLLHAALFDDLEATAANAVKRAKHRSLEEDLVAVAKTFFAYYAARPALSRALLRESLFASPPWSGRFAAQVGGLHQHLATLLEGAKTRGEVRADVGADVFGATFFSFYYFALLAWLQGGHPDPARLFRTLLTGHLSGLRPAGATPKTRRKR